MIIAYIILTIFFALNFTWDSVEVSKKSIGYEAPLIMIILKFVLDCIIWPFRLMRLIWLFMNKKK
jgi:uncharacterized integral membrane protein